MVAYEKAAEACERTDAQWHSAKHLELAAALARDLAKYKAVAQYSRQAALMYSEVGRLAAAAEALTKGGKYCEAGDTGIAAELYTEAFDMYADDDSGGGNAGSGGDAYRDCTAMMLTEKRYREAVEVLLKFGQACQRSKSTNSQCKAYLAAIVVWLYADDVVEANTTFQDLMQVDAFLESEEGAAAENLLRAYSTGDADEVKKVVEKNMVYRHIDTAVARLSKKLPTGDVTAAAAKLNGGAVSNFADELEEKEDLDDDDLC